MEGEQARFEVNTQIRQLNHVLRHLRDLRDASFTYDEVKPAGRFLSLAITELESVQHWLVDAGLSLEESQDPEQDVDKHDNDDDGQ